jgi:hypothetical protein
MAGVVFPVVVEAGVDLSCGSMLLSIGIFDVLGLTWLAKRSRYGKKQGAVIDGDSGRMQQPCVIRVHSFYLSFLLTFCPASSTWQFPILLRVGGEQWYSDSTS